MRTKICTKCKQDLPLTEEYYRIDKRINSFDVWCKNCHAEYNKKYRRAKKEKLVQYDKLYFQMNKETILARQKKYHKTHPAINKEKTAERNRKWASKNLEKIRIKHQKRRANKKFLHSTLTLEQWEIIKNHFNGKCAYCGKATKLTQDHFIALKMGGEYTPNNIVPSCVSCNSSKQTKSFFDWYPNFKCYSKKREKAVLEFLNYDSFGYQQLKFAETLERTKLINIVSVLPTSELEYISKLELQKGV